MAEMGTLELIRQEKIVAIIRGVAEEQILATVRALMDGGIRLLEITFDHAQPNAEEQTARKIALVHQHFGDQVRVGAGTVLTPQQVEMAAAAGAEYMISPHVDVSVIHKTKELGKVSIPGAMTPTEVVTAYQAGADIVKLFPAGELGIPYIKALMSPLKHIPMMVVGGVTPENVASFMKTGVCGVGVGGNLVVKEAIEHGRFEEIANMAQQYIQQLK